MVARLRPGADFAAARNELARLAERPIGEFARPQWARDAATSHNQLVTKNETKHDAARRAEGHAHADLPRAQAR